MFLGAPACTQTGKRLQQLCACSRMGHCWARPAWQEPDTPSGLCSSPSQRRHLRLWALRAGLPLLTAIIGVAATLIVWNQQLIEQHVLQVSTFEANSRSMATSLRTKVAYYLTAVDLVSRVLEVRPPVLIARPQDHSV